jgi:hypothetical protein
LRDAWAMERKTEWSIWMVYSKVEMPHHYINSENDEFSYRGVHKRVSSLLKLSDEVSSYMFFHIFIVRHVAEKVFFIHIIKN